MCLSYSCFYTLSHTVSRCLTPVYVVLIHVQVFSQALYHMFCQALARKLTPDELFAVQSLTREPTPDSSDTKHTRECFIMRRLNQKNMYAVIICVRVSDVQRMVFQRVGPLGRPRNRNNTPQQFCRLDGRDTW